MSRESAKSKSRRYIVEGRLRIDRVDGRTVHASCFGDGTIYTLGHDPVLPDGWHCDCPSRTLNCAHLLALRLVTAPNEADVLALRVRQLFDETEREEQWP
jgi:hypothetical protein